MRITTLTVPVVLATSLALTACSDDATTTTSTTTTVAPTTEAATTEAAPTTEATTAAATTEEPSPSADGGADDDAASGDVAEPGTEAEVGEALVTHAQALQKGDEYYGYATISTKVTSVEKGDATIWDKFSNAAEMKGYTPWLVSAEHTWLTYEGKPNANMLPRLTAVNGEGGEVSPVVVSGFTGSVTDDCTIEMPDEKGKGKTAYTCAVFAVPDGEEIGGVTWQGDDYADGMGTKSPYYENPVVWTVD